MTWWLWVRSPVEATFLFGVFSTLTSAEACEKSSWWLWKEKLCKYWCEKARKHICVTDRHDMTFAVKVALNPNTTNQLRLRSVCAKGAIWSSIYTFQYGNIFTKINIFVIAIFVYFTIHLKKCFTYCSLVAAYGKLALKSGKHSPDS